MQVTTGMPGSQKRDLDSVKLEFQELWAIWSGSRNRTQVVWEQLALLAEETAPPLHSVFNLRV